MRTVSATTAQEYSLLSLFDDDKNAFLVRYPVVLAQDRSLTAHAVMFAKVGDKEPKRIRPVILRLTVEMIEKSGGVNFDPIHPSNALVAEAAIRLAEKTLPMKKTTITSTGGMSADFWQPLPELQKEGHRLRWDILSVYFDMLLHSASVTSEGMGQIERFHMLFQRHHPTPPDFEAFKKAVHEMGIRFPRNADEPKVKLKRIRFKTEGSQGN